MSRGLKPNLSRDRDPLRKAPSAPKELSEYARQEWRRVMPRLIADGIITSADLGGIEDLCRARGLVRELELQIRNSTGEFDMKLVRLQDKAMQTARQLAAEYGLSPVSRTKIGSNAMTEDEDFL